MPEPRRLRWSVPVEDVSTNQWLDVQHSISRSLQLLVRESIERDGIIDVVNRPVQQRPRRGGPPPGAADRDGALSSVEPTDYSTGATGGDQFLEAQPSGTAHDAAITRGARAGVPASADQDRDPGTSTGQPSATRPAGPDVRTSIAAMLDMR
ncbi:hypothetical protein [Amycolatopsis sp. CA-230715]|uniref:hypothetical protein n=1 Tax=Amycolatopsis sp. CA-230715 TaxID=2745196 RepID=UPI001C01A52A|nr:hypothetical protein [Amycolatopsis sp. CA-230715]QWF85726.1 hypothetical protein HUW46_09206 [Amycolatopsis sp. CA-230715]